MNIDPTYKKTFEGSKENIVKYWQELTLHEDLGFNVVFGDDINKLEIGKSFWSIMEGHMIHRKTDSIYIFMYKDYDAFCNENETN
jgi:hypothetical protein